MGSGRSLDGASRSPQRQGVSYTLKMITTLKRKFFKILGYTPLHMPMVQYWKTKESVGARITRGKHGEVVMDMDGEAEQFPGFPRSHLLFGKLSKLKHEIKNQIFNDGWAMLEAGHNGKEMFAYLKSVALPRIKELAEQTRYDYVPVSKLNPAVKEIHRAWTKVAPASTYWLRDVLCFVLQEDDAYRFRAQWIVMWFGLFAKFAPLKAFDRGLSWLEHAETIGDMKERQRLLRRILMAILEDDRARALFIAFFKEVNWRKVAMTRADKFHFRGKYFKVDLDKFEY